MSLIKWQKGGLKSPLSKARGLGSGRTGVHHWIDQRVTAIANIPLTIWLYWTMITVARTDYVGFLKWMQNPVNTTLAILTILCFMQHAWLGMQIVVEDYTHDEGRKVVKLWIARVVLSTIAILGIISVLKLAFAPVV